MWITLRRRVLLRLSLMRTMSPRRTRSTRLSGTGSCTSNGGNVAPACLPTSAIRAGVTAAPRAFLPAFQRTTCDPRWIGPVRSLGPARSMSTLQWLPDSWLARRMCAIMLSHSRAESWAQFTRITSMPAATRPWIRSGESAASDGIVTMMRTPRPFGTAPIRSSACSARIADPVLKAMQAASGRGKRLLSFERLQNGNDGLDPGQRARFAASQRREAESGQARLEVPQIVFSQSEIMEQVLNAAPRLGTSLGDGLGKFPFHGQAGQAKFLKLGKKAGDRGHRTACCNRLALLQRRYSKTAGTGGWRLSASFCAGSRYSAGPRAGGQVPFVTMII